MSETDTAIIQWAARHAPDVTDAEIAVSLGVPMRAVKRASRGITPEVQSKAAEHRKTIGLLAQRLYEATGDLPGQQLTWEAIAELAGCTRQHLHRCRQEAKRHG